MKVLLLIDIQNDFIPGGALAVPEGDKIINTCNLIQEKFDLVVATQDWHPANHKSFASNHPGKKAFELIYLNGLKQVLWPTHCVQETEGAKFSKLLNMQKVEAIFRKGTDPEIDSYSGFYDNGHKKTTALDNYLKGKNITNVYIAGLAADYCVYYTANDAVAAGFTTYIIDDAVKAISEDGYKAAKQDVESKGVKIINSSSLNW